jgi:hypothetical protein
MLNRHRSMVFIVLMSVIILIVINSGQNVSAAVRKPASATDLYVSNLWRTGVDNSGNKSSANTSDLHYELTNVLKGGTFANRDGSPKALCQPGKSANPYNPIFPAPAVVVQDFNGGTSAGTSRSTGTHPWLGFTPNARWIGANQYGQDYSTQSCPNPSDFTNRGSWGGPYYADPTAPNGLNPDWVQTWNIYEFSAVQKFSVHASPNVDTSNLQLKLTATSDNELAIQINGCLLQAASYGVDEQTDEYTGSSTNWADAKYYQSDSSVTFNIPAGCLSLNGASPSNSIMFKVKSGDDLTGLRISDISITGFLAPNRPYFTVNGGDTVAGMPFNSGTPSTCTTIDSTTQAGKDAIIRSWNDDGNAGSYYGAGSQAGALALGQISSFVTGLNPAANPGDTPALQTSLSGRPTDVSFANTTPLNYGVASFPPPKYGGDFGSYGGCADDYFGSYVASGASPAGSVDLSSITSGVHSYKNNITLKGKLKKGIHATIVVNGSVAITGDISYAPYSLNSVPSLTVLSRDNIYVGDSVQEIHGFYVAQGGKFATCATKLGGSYAETTAYDSCNQQLTVYGAVAANAIHLDRSYGSIIGGGVGEPPAQPAEIFLFTPEAWLGGIGNCPADPASCLKNKSDYSVIKDLPPIL